MALIEKIRAIADAIRNKTGSTGLMTLDEMPEMIAAMDSSGGVTTLDNTYILVDENGYEVPASFTEEVVDLTATTNDIRIGTTAVTDEGVVTGEKEIPAYITTEGYRKIPAGSAMNIPLYSDDCNYTKFQALVCAFNTTFNDSVATEKVAIDNNVYAVLSTEKLASVAIDNVAQTIKLSMVNDSAKPVLIRYFTYREVS